jgi:hypothetical protein
MSLPSWPQSEMFDARVADGFARPVRSFPMGLMNGRATKGAVFYAFPRSG